MAPFDIYDFLLVHHCKYRCIWYRFLGYLTLNDIMTLKTWLEVTRRHSNLVP